MSRALAVVLAALVAAAPAVAAPFDVGRYESPGVGPVNSWWIETPGGGLIVVDAQRDAASAAAAITAIRVKRLPVRAILVTHPHPDHVSGLIAFKAAFPDAPVIAQAGTRDEFAADPQKLLSAEGAPRPPDPDRVVGDEPFVVDGVRIVPAAMGSGESVSQTVYWIPERRILIGGDLATPTLIPFLAEGRTGAWLAQLDVLEQRYQASARLLPGHGPETRLANATARQARLLIAYREGVRAALGAASPGGAAITSAERGALDQAMRTRFGLQGQVAGLPPAKLSQLNADAVAGELTGR